MKYEFEDIQKIYDQSFPQLLFQAHQIHRISFDPTEIQLSTLLSIKTGGCPENCAYCPQSAHHQTGVQKQKLMATEEVVEKAQRAKESGATRFCMGAAWREVKDGPEFDQVLEMVKEVNKLGLQTCCTLGMLSVEQAKKLKDAGLYAYNHNIDTSREFYEKIISTRNYDDRLKTIENVRSAGITVCTGGIIGMGESDEDRIEFLRQLVSFNPVPESVTINSLISIKGTPLQDRKPVSIFDLVRVVATARILMPSSMIRLSAGRVNMSDEGQFLCFFAGANSIFMGEKLLTSPNPELNSDRNLFESLQYSAQEMN